jgi:hypothetical protein
MQERRNNNRMQVRLTGYLVCQGKAKTFCTRNISETGIQAHFDGYEGMYQYILSRMLLPSMQLGCYVYPIWQKPADEGGFDMGFKFFKVTTRR